MGVIKAGAHTATAKALAFVHQSIHSSIARVVAVALAAACCFSPLPRVSAIGGSTSLTVVISQVYGGAGCGTAGCSTYQNDYIELYNRSHTAISLNGWSVQYAAATGTAWQVTALPNVTVQPGQYYLVAESFGANGVNPLPTPDTTGIIAMSATAGKIALVNATTALTGACPGNITGAGSIIDFVGYGATANCNETANAPAPSTTTADVRAGGGNTETDNNSTDFQATAPTPRNTSSTLNTPTAADGVVAGRITAIDGSPVAGVVVSLSGNRTRKTITDANGNYRFNNIETTGFYTVRPSRADYLFSPTEKSFSQLGGRTEAAFVGSTSGAYANPIDTPEFFVRQQYVDVLGREPDELGFNYWSDQILSCGADLGCSQDRRTGVAAAFFVEQEFRQSGAFIVNVYRGALGRHPQYSQYAADRTQVVGGATLEAQKREFAAAFVNRPEFVDRYANKNTAESFVDALLANVQSAGVDLASERDSLIARYREGSSQNERRMIVLRALTENTALQQANANAAFVLVEYFAYLHRNPDPQGYDFWLNALNEGAHDDYRGMVCSFITSGEYQRRFSALVSHSNTECGQ
jgi:hypothetical protein